MFSVFLSMVIFRQVYSDNQDETLAAISVRSVFGGRREGAALPEAQTCISFATNGPMFAAEAPTNKSGASFAARMVSGEGVDGGRKFAKYTLGHASAI